METATDTRSPDEIEREIRRTQHEMSDTVDKLGDQFTPRNIVNGLLDKADENGIDARYMLDAARRNPIALGMIAIGGIWLASDSDARLKTLKSGVGMDDTNGSGASRNWDDTHHKSYVEHMSQVEPRANEDPALYLRRRDCARATFLLIEQGHDEDESSFRQRLDEQTEKMRERRDRMMDGMHRAGDSTRQGAARIASKTKSAYSQNPLLGGLAAAFVGAIAGATVPVTRTEEEKFGHMGSDAIDMAKDKARQAGDMAREKKDELVDKADEKMGKSGSSGESSGQRQQMPNPQFDPV